MFKPGKLSSCSHVFDQICCYVQFTVNLKLSSFDMYV